MVVCGALAHSANVLERDVVVLLALVLVHSRYLQHLHECENALWWCLERLYRVLMCQSRM